MCFARQDGGYSSTMRDWRLAQGSGCIFPPRIAESFRRRPADLGCPRACLGGWYGKRTHLQSDPSQKASLLRQSDALLGELRPAAFEKAVPALPRTTLERWCLPGRPAADLFGVDVGTADGSELVALQGQVLVVGGDSGVSDDQSGCRGLVFHNSCYVSAGKG